jgi:putative ABC transport system permease protein
MRLRSPALLTAAMIAGATCAGAGRCGAADADAFAPNAGPGRVGEVRLSERAARSLGVEAGDTLEASSDERFATPERYRVFDVYRPHADPGEVGRDSRYSYFHADDLERLTGTPDRVQRFVVWLADPARAAIVRDRLGADAYGFDAYTSRELADHSSSTFVVIARFQAAIAWLALAAGAVFLVTLMVLKVEERKRELAMLRLTGISRRTVVTSLVFESLVVALLGSALGVGLGLVFSRGVNAYYRVFYGTDLVFSRVSPGVVGTAVAVALPLGVVAAMVAAWRLLGGLGVTRGTR